jgi:hypothetical protein
MNNVQFEKLDRKMDLVLKMLAIDKLYGKKQIEQVAILTELGMETGEIASIIGIKSSSVSAQQIQWRKRSKKPPGGTPNEQE